MKICSISSQNDQNTDHIQKIIFKFSCTLNHREIKLQFRNMTNIVYRILQVLENNTSNSTNQYPDTSSVIPFLRALPPVVYHLLFRRPLSLWWG